jgi:hypothetical protein
MGFIIEQKTEYDRTIHRLTKNGVVDIEVGPDDYVEPADGEKLLMISGYSDSFPLEGKFGLQTKIRLECRIEEGQDKGGRFASIFTVSVNPKSNLGKVLAAANGAPIDAPKVDIEDFLGKRFYGVTTMKISETSGKPYVSIDSARAAKSAAPAKSNGKTAPQADDDDWPSE